MERKIYIVDEWDTGEVRLMVREDSGKNMANVYLENGVLTRFEVVNSISSLEPNFHKPFLKIPEKLFREIAAEIVNYANKNNINTKTKDYNEGVISVISSENEFLKQQLVKFIDYSTK